MKKRSRALFLIRRFFRRFNPWLFLACVALATLIFCVTMYVEDPYSLRETLSAVATSSETAI